MKEVVKKMEKWVWEVESGVVEDEWLMVDDEGGCWGLLGIIWLLGECFWC